MINTFSLILLVITGISGAFWCISKFYILICNCAWYKSRVFLQTSKNLHQKSKNVFLLFFSFCIDVFNFISSIFPILLLVFIVRSFVIEPFQIPSGSMMPTLLIGDFILVKKFSYGIKNPINQKMLFTVKEPKRGDVIVFKYPKNPKLDYIKRVIGRPGDKVVYNMVSKQLTIYPRDANNMYAKELPVIYSDIIFSDFVQEFYTTEKGLVNTRFFEIEKNYQHNSVKGIRLIQTTESLDGMKHNILTMISPGDKNFLCDRYVTTHLISEWIVPVGKYFVMGDNRDNSADSRYWGYVSERNIVGQAVIVWMSVKKQEGKWPVGIRLNRVGNIIR